VEAWFPSPTPIPANASPADLAKLQAENALRQRDRDALTSLRRIGNALSTRRSVEGMGAYESVGAVTIVGNLMRGNFGAALITAVGFEGLPLFVSTAMYNPRLQRYLFEAAAPEATVTSRTAAFLHMIKAYEAARENAVAANESAL
jgi:hypothetical protein